MFSVVHDGKSFKEEIIMVAIIPATADKIYSRRVDEDEDVLYVKPKNGKNYVRIHRHKATGKLYNNYYDVIPEDRFNSKLRKGTKKLSEADWKNIKKEAKRK